MNIPNNLPHQGNVQNLTGTDNDADMQRILLESYNAYQQGNTTTEARAESDLQRALQLSMLEQEDPELQRALAMSLEDRNVQFSNTTEAPSTTSEGSTTTEVETNPTIEIEDNDSVSTDNAVSREERITEAQDTLGELPRILQRAIRPTHMGGSVSELSVEQLERLIALAAEMKDILTTS